MRQILFHIPLSFFNSDWPDLPIYGYGLMLFIAFLCCNALAQRLCKRQGIDPALVPDLVIWLFVAGIFGGRVVYIIQYWNGDGRGTLAFADRPIWDLLKLWDGGLVLYGALFGGAVGYFAYHHFVLKKHGITHWKMLDVVAPCVALGVALGRIGCLCTGCCYGNVACPGTPHIEFPRPSSPWDAMVHRGYQSPLGFLLKERSLEVEAVEPGSAADAAGLQAGDRILAVDGETVRVPHYIGYKPGEGEKPIDTIRTSLALTVDRVGERVPLPEFTPHSIGLNPTQIYETISMSLLLFLLLSYFPFRRRDGELLVILMLAYAVHRYLNEMLRTDTAPVAFGLTLSQNISIGIFAAGVVLSCFVYRRPTIEQMKSSSVPGTPIGDVSDASIKAI